MVSEITSYEEYHKLARRVRNKEKDINMYRITDKKCLKKMLDLKEQVDRLLYGFIFYYPTRILRNRAFWRMKSSFNPRKCAESLEC